MIFQGLSITERALQKASLGGEGKTVVKRWDEIYIYIIHLFVW